VSAEEAESDSETRDLGAAPAPGRWDPLRAWVRPPPSPAPLRFATTSEALLEELGDPNPEVTDELLLEAQAAYDEAAERAESAERRATTIQGSIAIAASLTLAGGSLLLNGETPPSRPWSVLISTGFALTVVLLAVAAWRAFLVTWPRFLWASPAVLDVQKHAREVSVNRVKLQRTADLLVSYGRNDSIARLKLALLGQAVRWLMAALGLLAVVAVMVAAYAIDRPSSKHRATHCHPPMKTDACRLGGRGRGLPPGRGAGDHVPPAQIGRSGARTHT